MGTRWVSRFLACYRAVAQDATRGTPWKDFRLTTTERVEESGKEETLNSQKSIMQCV